MKSARLGWVGVVGLVLVTGCAIDPSADVGDEEVSATAVCATQHSGRSADGDAVTVCDKTYTTLPFVRPPADKKTSSSVTLYVGISDMMEGGRFVTRDGKVYALADSKGKVLSMTGDTTNAIVKSLRMPSNRNLFMVYKVTGELGTGTDQFNSKVDTIKAKSAKPVILIDGKAIDTAQTFGAFEGTVAASKSDTSFDPNKRVKVRIRFTSVASKSSGDFAEWGTSATLDDGDHYQVKGTIENFSSSVKAADGSCIPSLAAMGTSNPFAGAKSGAVTLDRIGGMHFPGDDEHVLTMPAGAKGWSITSMGTFGRFLPADFISTEPGSGSMTPHGTPTGAGIELTAVTGGGGGC